MTHFIFLQSGSHGRDEPQRRSWHQQDDSHDSAYRSRSDSNSDSSSRKSLHNLSATPKQKIISGQDWILSDEERRRQERTSGRVGTGGSSAHHSRHSDIMRQHVPNTSDHWLVEEAERRRRAEKGGQDRPAGVTQSRPHHPNHQSNQPSHPHTYPTSPQSISPGGRSGYWMGEEGSQPAPQSHRVGGPYDQDVQSSSSSYSNSRDYRSPTHIMEHTEAPGGRDWNRPSRPIPEEIKQTLLQRVSQAKYSQSSQSLSSTSPPGHTGSGSPNTSYPYTPSPAPSYQYTSPSQQYPQQYHDQSGYSHPQHQHPYSSSYPDVNANQPPAPPTKPPRSTPGVGGPVAPPCGHTHAEVVSVSGHQKCAHCEEELGEGTKHRTLLW